MRRSWGCFSVEGCFLDGASDSSLDVAENFMSVLQMQSYLRISLHACLEWESCIEAYAVMQSLGGSVSTD